MNISGIRPQVGFYDNNSMKVRPEISPIPSEQVVPEKEQKQPQGFGEGPAATVELSQAGVSAAKRNIERAVSDMEKDTAIHRYQYFVKKKPAEDDSAIRGNENFTL